LEAETNTVDQATLTCPTEVLFRASSSTCLHDFLRHYQILIEC